MAGNDVTGTSCSFDAYVGVNSSTKTKREKDAASLKSSVKNVRKSSKIFKLLVTLNYSGAHFADDACTYVRAHFMFGFAATFFFPIFLLLLRDCGCCQFLWHQKSSTWTTDRRTDRQTVE